MCRASSASNTPRQEMSNRPFTPGSGNAFADPEWRVARWGLAAIFSMWKRLRQFAGHRLLVCALMGVLPIGIRLATLRYVPFPDPNVSDEFSYLLGADTFASGRITNPPHPMWQHFETWHVISQPTYASRYPPAQAVFLAIGQKFLGHPLFGVWLSFALMCACLCWMLQGWMPPVYALLGTLAGMGQIGIFGYWMNSYWGGAVAAAGGCLVLGACVRLARAVNLSAAICGSLGVALLAFSRPLEGSVVIAVAGAMLLVSRRKRGRELAHLLAPAVVVPVLLIGGLTAVAMAYYNYRVTGHPLELPYVLYERTYAKAPFLLFLPTRQLTYRHEALRKYYSEVSMYTYFYKRSHPWHNITVLLSVLPFYSSTLVCFALLAGALFLRTAKIRTALAVLAVLCLLVLAEKSPHIHYIAPGCGLVFAISMSGMRLLALQAKRFGPGLLVLFAGIVFGQGLMDITYAHVSNPNPHTILEKDLIKQGGQHLVIVHAEVTYPPGSEYVYNRANIDRSPVVWARDMGPAKNQELVD
jgi:hypothetical protein